MELLEGQTLKHRIEGKPFTAEQTVDYRRPAMPNTGTRIIFSPALTQG